VPDKSKAEWRKKVTRSDLEKRLRRLDGFARVGRVAPAVIANTEQAISRPR
jgi:hypothetical protein